MRYEVTTGLTPRQAREQAIAYFDYGGVGLGVISQSPHGLVFQGGGGHVAITVQSGVTTALELETREWDVAVRRSKEQVSYRPRWWSHWWRRKRAAAPPAPVFTIYMFWDVELICKPYQPPIRPYTWNYPQRIGIRPTAMIALHNFCIWLNEYLTRPRLAFADLIAW
jgi:hypothetical protein